ncbi:MAG: PH domain-containing protein [Alphaproteobacteria bacterium]|jgi:hypothetical protein|nr:PH domain-containing protein [Alphaproteobacteria bacterium]
MAATGETDPWLAGLLVEGETPMAAARIHPGIYWRGATLLVLGVALAIVVMPLGVLLIAAAGLMLCLAAVLQSYLRLALTDRRVLARYGLLVNQVVTLDLDKVESLETEQMLPGLVLGYADIVITGVGLRAFRIPFVANAEDLRRAYSERRHHAQTAKE